MKFKALFVIILLLGGNINAQNFHENRKRKEITNLFEYGEPITSSEVNLKNLFENFPLFVSNSKEINLISYKRVGIIKNKMDANKYVGENIHPRAPKWGVFRGTPEIEIYGDSSVVKGYPCIKLITDSYFDSNKSEIKEIISTLVENYIKVNDEVFEIKFEIGLKTYNHYVFVNPESYKVNLKGNLFGFDLPMDLIRYYESKNQSHLID